MEKQITTRQWIDLFVEGEFDGDSVKTQIAGRLV